MTLRNPLLDRVQIFSGIEPNMFIPLLCPYLDQSLYGGHMRPGQGEDRGEAGVDLPMYYFSKGMVPR